jgi:hypothetical protein
MKEPGTAPGNDRDCGKGLDVTGSIKKENEGF